MCLIVIVGLYHSPGQYGVVEAALYIPSPGSAPIKVAIKKTKVCFNLCVRVCMCVCMCVHACVRVCVILCTLICRRLVLNWTRTISIKRS